jgi:hypothetical protein
MAGDRARVSYDPSRKWRGLVAQQGRVTVEADWNEATAIVQERDRHLTLDVVGPVGTPDRGYAVTAVPATGGPPGSTPGDLLIGPGTLYVGGQRLDLDAPVDYALQPDWLDCSSDPLWHPPAVPATPYEIVYLLASEQEVSAVEDPALADVALGGPDTMQRQRILQHFVRHPSPSGNLDDSWSAVVGSLQSAGLQFDAATMMVKSTTTLQVSFADIPTAPSLCQPVVTGGYLGAENQMIRVMVTNADTSGVPAIVWGFDDASFLYRIQAATYDSSSNTTTLTLASAPVDSFHMPVAGQAVEVLRDAGQLTATSPVQLQGTDFIASPAGFVTHLTSAYDPTRRQLMIFGPLPPDYLSAATPQLFLRVWQAALAAPPGQPIPLVTVNQAGTAADTGVAVTLSSSTGAFHDGDFWRFALRPIQPAIVYPGRYLTGPQPPDGPRTWACPLAVLQWEAGSATALHGIPPFADLVELTAKGGCCTVDVGPSDVDDGASLPALLRSYANKGPITICLEPGTYTLPAPLVLDPGFDGLTLQGCREGVVLRAPSGPGAGFMPGLIAVHGASAVTIRGIELAPPPVAFLPPAGSFAGLTTQNQVLLSSFSAELQVAFGISASSAAGLAIEDCTFSLPDPGGTSFFGAGIYATGTMTGVTVTNCTFRSASTLTTAPFYDLAAGSQHQPQPPWQLTFGCLQVPLPPPASTVAGGQQLLDDAAIQHCLFQDVTVPALLMAELGSLSIDRNTVRDSYGGFWLVSLDPAHFNYFDQNAIGEPAQFLTFASQGNAPLLDRILVIAPAIGQVLPRPISGPPLPGTSVSLRLDFRDCQVDAVLGGSNSGAGLLIADFAEATGSAVVHGNRIRNHFPAGDTALAHLLEEASVTGNILANEVAAAELSAQNTNNFSIVLSATATPLGVAAVAVTGNVLVGPTMLPPRPTNTIPAVLLNWDVLNTVISYVVPPVVTGISPTSGTPAGGDSVTITGHGFTGATSVQFVPTGSTSPSGAGTPATAMTVVSDTQITATSPAGSPGTVHITVTTPAGTSAKSAADQFTYTTTPAHVTGINPTFGTFAGGTSVTITGSGFLGATGVQFGTTAAAAMTIGSDTQITATSPAGSPGTVPITVTNRAGQSDINTAPRFTYISPPTVTGVSPASGTAVGGTIVTIAGRGFSFGNVSVQFGTVSAPAMTVVSDTQITATSPAGTGAVDITVSNPAGTSATSGADRFAYIPAITGISPASGPVTGGTTVTITGAGFTGATSVRFGTANAAMTVSSDTQITATSPPAASPGTVDITVTTPTGTSPASSADQFAYLPAVTGVEPNSGFTTGGDSVTITGAGFTGATSVQFGTANAAMTVNSDTQITATSPRGSVGGVDVTVTTPAGTSAISRPADVFRYTRKPPKETFAKEKEGVVKEQLPERTPFATPAVAAEEMPGGTAEAFIDPSERPDVGAHLRGDNASAPEQG